jgi:hypothetical protein
MRLGDFAVVDRYKKRRAEIEARYKNLKYQYPDLAGAPQPKERWLSKYAKYEEIPSLEYIINPFQEQIKNLLVAKIRETAVSELLATGILTKPEYHLLLTHLHRLKSKTEATRAKLDASYLKHTPKVLWPDQMLRGQVTDGRSNIRALRGTLERLKVNPKKSSFYFNSVPKLDSTITQILNVKSGRKLLQVSDSTPPKLAQSHARKKQLLKR